MVSSTNLGHTRIIVVLGIADDARARQAAA
jgi:hypothetical protein